MVDIDESNLKQFKLVDGEEIICEVLEDLEDDLIIRYALKIVKVDINISRSYYLFRNWMTFQEEANDTVSLSKFHVMGIAIPSPVLLGEYYSAIESVKSHNKENDNSSMYDMLEELGLVPTRSLDGDSSDSNIISMVDRNKLH